MDYDNFFQISDYLKDHIMVNNEEICYRTIINRIHYAIFHLIQAALSIHIPPEKKENCHSYLRDFLEQNGDLYNPDLCISYKQILIERNNADYDLDEVVTNKNVRFVEENRDEIINILRDVCNTS